MQCYEAINVLKIKEIVLKKAKYQKVVLLMDSETDLDLLDSIEKEIKNDVVYFCLNVDIENFVNIQKIISDGTRCVILLLSDFNYIKINPYYDFNLITIDVFKDKLLPLHFKNNESYFLFYENKKLSVEDQLLICNYVIEWKWQNLIASKNYNTEEKMLLSIFTRNDLINCKEFYDLDFFKELEGVEAEYYQPYLFIRIMAIKYLFLAFLESSQMMIDVYKSYSDNLDEVNFVYKLYRDERTNFLFKSCNKVMLDFINILMASVSVHFSVNKNEICNILKNIKIKAKNIKKDNLLKYCFLYGIFENI